MVRALAVGGGTAGVGAARDTSALEIIDARRFEEPAVARVRLPHRVPPGFHGNWVPTPPAG